MDPTDKEQQEADFEMILAAHPSTDQVTCHKGSQEKTKVA